MKNYSYLKKLDLDVVSDESAKKDYVDAYEVNQKVQDLIIKNTELLHALRQIKVIATDYNLKTRLQDVLKAIHEVTKKNLMMFGEEVDK